MNAFFLVYDPTFEEWLILFGGVFIVFLIAFLVTRYTKYGGGSNYGMTGKFDDDFTDFHDDFDDLTCKFPLKFMVLSHAFKSRREQAFTYSHCGCCTTQ